MGKQGYTITPVGAIKKMFLARPVTSKKYPGDPMYVIRLEFSDVDDECRELRETLEGVNPALVITKNVTEGTFAVNFKTKWKPTVIDADGNEMAEVPYFNTETDTGEAAVCFTTYTNGINGSISLKDVMIAKLNVQPYKGSSGKEDRLAALKARLKTGGK